MKARERGGIDRAAAREFFEPLVAVGDARGAQHGLHGLAEHFPGAVEVLRAMRAGSASILARPRPSERQAMSVWPSATPRLRSTVESVRSRCQREIGSFSEKCRSSALATPRLPSAFSKSIGLTLCGMVEEPTSPATGRCRR